MISSICNIIGLVLLGVVILQLRRIESRLSAQDEPVEPFVPKIRKRVYENPLYKRTREVRKAGDH
jgi:hypothetical protein